MPARSSLPSSRTKNRPVVTSFQSPSNTSPAMTRNFALAVDGLGDQPLDRAAAGVGEARGDAPRPCAERGERAVDVQIGGVDELESHRVDIRRARGRRQSAADAVHSCGATASRRLARNAALRYARPGGVGRRQRGDMTNFIAIVVRLVVGAAQPRRLRFFVLDAIHDRNTEIIVACIGLSYCFTFVISRRWQYYGLNAVSLFGMTVSWVDARSTRGPATAQHADEAQLRRRQHFLRRPRRVAVRLSPADLAARPRLGAAGAASAAARLPRRQPGSTCSNQPSTARLARIARTRSPTFASASTSRVLSLTPKRSSAAAMMLMC